MADYKTPGVYIEEKNAFPNSAVAVETAIPVFIGYTQKAERKGKSLFRVPTRITSFSEYVESFGGPFNAKYTVVVASKVNVSEVFKLGDTAYSIDFAENSRLYFFNSIRLFYANGGGTCYILSVGIYGNHNVKQVITADYKTSDANPQSPFDLLELAYDSTLIVLPDLAALGADAYPIYKDALIHCAKTQSRFAVFDVRYHNESETTNEVVQEFREEIGTNELNYGAAYYPWLNASIVVEEEITFENFDDLNFLNDPAVLAILSDYKSKLNKLGIDQSDVIKAAQENNSLMKECHLALKTASEEYSILLAQAILLTNKLPPSGAMAGIYSMIDNSRGVWKAPANCSLNNVDSPVLSISNEMQESINVDPINGISINVIRSFKGLGTMVWGGRTLDGNSQDWKYINVRRTLIMIEQSIKSATRAYVFEPNDANTWITVKAMINNFLTNLWKQGALAGASPEQAFDVQIGLGATMTPTDILDGKMLITVKVAIVRPAEFIIITFQQQLQQS